MPAFPPAYRAHPGRGDGQRPVSRAGVRRYARRLGRSRNSRVVLDLEQRRLQVNELLRECSDAKLLRGGSGYALERAREALELATRAPAGGLPLRPPAAEGRRGRGRPGG